MSPFIAALECVDCGALVRRFERGWRAYLTCEDADEPEEPVEVAVLCPGCSARRLAGEA